MTIACSGLAGYIHRMIRRTALLFLFLASIHAHAQNATITSFRYNTMDTAYSIYGDTSTVYVYKGADGGLAVAAHVGNGGAGKVGAKQGGILAHGGVR